MDDLDAELEGVDAAQEVYRAVAEARQSLGALAQSGRLAYPLMGIGPLLDRSKIGVTDDAGDSAFLMNEEAGEILFRSSIVVSVYRAAWGLAREIGAFEPDERRRVAQNAVNLFVIHELEHVHQNFPQFAHVAEVKAGLPKLGLPLLDAAADTVAAWANANIEAERLGVVEESEVLLLFANMLVLSYVVGALVFDAKTNPEKTQRALGLLAASALIQASVSGLLDESAIFKDWTPLTPLLVMDMAATETFNVLVIDKVPGLLFRPHAGMRKELVRELWDSVGTCPVARTLDLTFAALRSAGAVKDAAANEAGTKAPVVGRTSQRVAQRPA